MYYEEIEAFCEKYDKTEKPFAFRAETISQHEEWRQRARERLREISGIVMCEPTNADYRQIEKISREGYVEEYWLMDTEPKIVMPFYLLRPDLPNGAAVLIPHGHGGGKETSLNGLNGLAAHLAQNGFFVFCPDERGCGERRERFQQGDSDSAKRSNSHRELLQIAVGFGQSVIGLAVWDLMRLIDFAQTIPQIRRDAIGCVGMSGGGFQTLWLSALDQRIHSAVTSGYFYGMRDSLVRMSNNCACNFVPFMWQTMDMGDMGAMIAPRPLFIESGREDPLNGHRGLDNVREQLAVTQKAYALYGAEKNLIHKIHPNGHMWVGDGVTDFLFQTLCR